MSLKYYFSFTANFLYYEKGKFRIVAAHVFWSSITKFAAHVSRDTHSYYHVLRSSNDVQLLQLSSWNRNIIDLPNDGSGKEGNRKSKLTK